MIGERIESMPFKCHICGGHFHKKSNLQRHWRIYHEISDFEVESITRVLLQSDKTDFTQMAGLSFKITCRFCPQVFHAETSPETRGPVSQRAVVCAKGQSQVPVPDLWKRFF